MATNDTPSTAQEALEQLYEAFGYGNETKLFQYLTDTVGASWNAVYRYVLHLSIGDVPDDLRGEIAHALEVYNATP